MPTYEYECPKGHRFERFYPKVTDRRHAACPTCGKRATRLISGGAGLVFKGSGFYITDYKRAGEKPHGEGEAKSAEQKPETKAESTTASKPEAKSKKDSRHK
jgi:putative FmdB family regulatory protein